MTPQARRQRQLERQIRVLDRIAPGLRRIAAPGWWMLRLPLAILLILGSVLAILPVFGLWMLPAGLLLLAVDLPLLQGPVSAAIIRSRRRLLKWRLWLLRRT